MTSSAVLPLLANARLLVVTRDRHAQWLSLLESFTARGATVMFAPRMPNDDAQLDVLVCDGDVERFPRHRRAPIVVAESFSPEREIELIRGGVCACVRKDNLDLLEATIERELSRALRRSVRQEERDKLQADLVRWVDLVRNIPGAAWEQRFERDGVEVSILSPQQIARITGHTAEEWLANPDLWMALLHPEDRERAIAEVERVGAAGTGGVIRFRWIRRDGVTIWVEAHCFPIRDDAGRLVGMRGISMDITDRQLAQDRSRMLARAVEAANDLVLITDEEGCVIYANRAFLETTGWKLSEIEGERVAHVVAPDWIDDFVGGEAVAPRRRFGTRRDGSVFDALVRVTGMRGDDGRVTGHVVVATEVAAIERGEADALRNERKLRVLSEAAFDGLVVHDFQKILEINRAAANMYGFAPEDMIGMDVRRIMHPEDEAKTIAAMRSGLARYETRGVRGDGSTIYAEVSAANFREPDGSMTRICAIRDLTEIREARQELARREGQFRALVEAAFDGMLLARDGIIEHCNETLAGMLQYPVADLIGMRLDQVISGHVDGASEKYVESFAVTRDGTPFPIEFCMAVGADGQRLYAVRDVTVQKAAEYELIRSERRHRELTELSHDMICEHDLEGRINDVNPAAVRVLGYSREQLCRMSVVDLLEPEFREQFADYLATIQADGFAEGLMALRTASGERRIWHYRNTLRTAVDEPAFVRGLACDVTEREDALQALRQSERLFRNLIENGSDVICLIEPNGIMRYNSPSTERVLGYAQDELLNRPFIEYIHEEDRAVAQLFFEQQKAWPAKQSDVDLRVLHKDGSFRWFAVVASNVVRDGQIVSIISNARDITERRHLESQLEQANRLTSLGRLAATVAHEFNNVLMGIQPFADLMQLPNATPQMIQKAAAHIASSVARGKRVTLDILRFTRPAQPSLTVVDLHSWWERLSVEMKATIGNNIDFTTDFIDDELAVMADGAQLSQVMSNLIANARDAMPSGGKLTVRARRPHAGQSYQFGLIIAPETFVHLSVEDTGIGMPEEVRRHVFDPLFTTKQRGGTGLGLAVAHQVVTRHNGAIFVESEPGRGSTFHIFLPRATAQPAQSECNETTRVRAKRMLLVEDEQVIALGLRETLRTRGIDVEIVARGEEAVDAARRIEPEVAIVDMRLPGIDGTEVGRRLRAEWPKLTMVFVSGDAGEVVAGDDVGFLRKPFTIDALLQCIHRLEAGA